MKKPTSKKLFRRLLLVFLAIVELVIIINIPIIILNHKVSDIDYSNWMAENLENEKLVVDIAMLGAHDAFTSEINILSKLDPYESNGIMQGMTGVLVKGFITKQSVTQISDANTLLKSGVRYLDIRLSYYEDKWLTKHNYLSGDFEPVATQITSFLEENSGEFLILDFQHVDGIDYSSLDDYYIFKNMLEDYGLLDYSYIVNDLSTLTYGELTNNASESRVIIISKFEDSSIEILNYEESIRSNWADSDSFDYVIDFIQEEANDIESTGIHNQFRVMQAVTTMQMNGSGILNAILSWSLINRAKNFNTYLIAYDQFEALLDELPIIMVDYSDMNSKEFNDNIMQIIMDFN
ncbi:MAG: hypothetical protein JEZ05_02940 [Tenericutes bacterium]|nr:hypothetical protein [Mycoplasmatota bacterium]